jgi:hypothetical protein
MGTTT